MRECSTRKGVSLKAHHKKYTKKIFHFTADRRRQAGSHQTGSGFEIVPKKNVMNDRRSGGE